MYRYDDIDATLVAERVAQFRDQTRRFLDGKLPEEEFRPLRLRNGLYIQKHAPMLRIAIPYGLLSSRQLRMLGHLARKYMSTMNGVDGEYRTRLFHAIRDLTADSYGGWSQVTNIQAGGGLYAQRIVTRRHYDLDKAKQSALKVAGLADAEA